MAIFSRLRGNKSNAAAGSAVPEKQVVPFEERAVYVPKHAIRDAVYSSPTRQNREDKQAMKRAHEERAARMEYERSMQQYSMSNPKLAISRGSSSPSTPSSHTSASSSTRLRDPFSNATSYTDLSSLSGPSKPRTSPRIPYQTRSASPSPATSPASTPASCLSQCSTAQSTPPPLSPVGSMTDKAKGKMPEQPTVLQDVSPRHTPVSASSILTSPLPETKAKRPELRRSISTEETWAALSMMLSNEELPKVVASALTIPDDAASVYSSDSISPGTVLPRTDSTRPSPKLRTAEKCCSVQARKLDKGPVLVDIPRRSSRNSGKGFFDHQSAWRERSVSPCSSVDGPSIRPLSGRSPRSTESLRRQTMVNAF